MNQQEIDASIREMDLKPDLYADICTSEGTQAYNQWEANARIHIQMYMYMYDLIRPLKHTCIRIHKADHWWNKISLIKHGCMCAQRLWTT